MTMEELVNTKAKLKEAELNFEVYRDEQTKTSN
jgi:hypothetical protein